MPALTNGMHAATDGVPALLTQAEAFAEVDIDTVLSKLTMSEKIEMLAGADWWNTVAVPRLVSLSSVRSAC